MTRTPAKYWKERAEKAERMEQLLSARVDKAEAERDTLRALIDQHNVGCDASCGKTTTLPYVRDSRRCDPRRDCPDCPRDWKIG